MATVKNNIFFFLFLEGFFFFLFLGVFACSYSMAKDLGTWGNVWQIKEQDAIEQIQGKLQGMEASGELAVRQEELKQKIINNTKRPKPVKNVIATENCRSFNYDPTITVKEDIKDHAGNIVQPKGARVNPFDYVGLEHEIIFLDGDNEQEVIWSLEKYKTAQSSAKPTLVLTRGAPLELTTKHKITFYFDQSGTLTKKLGITQVPAIVSQKGRELLIKEVKLKEGSDGVIETDCA